MSLHNPKTNELFEDHLCRPLRIFGVGMYIDVLESVASRPALKSYTLKNWLKKVRKEGIRDLRALRALSDLLINEYLQAHLRAYEYAGGKISDLVVPQIDCKILASTKLGKWALDMGTWHGSNSCGTTHCRAGGAITEAGIAGKELEDFVGSFTAGAMIYKASRPSKPIPNFYASTEVAMKDIELCAAGE